MIRRGLLPVLLLTNVVVLGCNDPHDLHVHPPTPAPTQLSTSTPDGASPSPSREYIGRW